MDKKRIVVIISFIIIFIVAIVISQMHYKDKYIVVFETGTDESILTQYIEKNGTVIVPKEPTKEGFIFKEWQLNGKKFCFDTEIKENIILSAKWIKEEYVTVSFNTNNDLKIDSIKVLKGDILKDLPDIEVDDYEFIGWYLNDNLYSNEEINYDVELYANYKNEKINTTYQIGDKVIIIGRYSNSAYSIKDYYDIALGWDRVIIDIIDDSEFPYMIGNENGVTGFFKSSSIKEVQNG